MENSIGIGWFSILVSVIGIAGIATYGIIFV